MRSWKIKSRAERRKRYHAWRNSDNNHDHKSRWGKRRFYPVYSWEGWGHRSWRKNEKLLAKGDAKHVKDGLAKFAEFPYYEDCRYHVCKQLKVEQEGRGRIGVEGESLINGSWSNCSYEHCGIVHLTKEEGEERAAFVKQMGMMPYQLKYVYGIPEDPADLEKSLRYSLGMERVWEFNKNGGTEEITDNGKKWLLDTTGIVYDDLKPMEEEEMQKALAEAQND